MPARNRLMLTLWLTSLLAAVLIAPLRTAVRGPECSQPGCVRLDSVPPVSQSTPCLRSSAATDALVSVNDLPAENEEQDRADAVGEPQLSFVLPRLFQALPRRQTIALCWIPSLYPMRC